MVPPGSKQTKNSGKTSVKDRKTSMEDREVIAHDFEKEDKRDLSGSEEDATDGTVYLVLCSHHVLQFVYFEPTAF